MTTNDWEKEIKKWKENQGGACACLGDCEVCGYHKCHGCICNLIKVILANYQSKLIAELEGMKKDTENIEVPKGSNIGEYRFIHSLKNEGHNQALDLIIYNLRERIQ